MHKISLAIEDTHEDNRKHTWGMATSSTNYILGRLWNTILIDLISSIQIVDANVKIRR